MGLNFNPREHPKKENKKGRTLMTEDCSFFQSKYRLKSKSRNIDQVSN